MFRLRARRVVLLGLLAAVLTTAGAADPLADPSPNSWPQWGGPNRDFKAPAGPLASAWSETGPSALWSRRLGTGYSAILFEDDRLYTMYRAGAEEVVVCLEAATGTTVWEHRYPQQPHEDHVLQHGVGPRSTPLIAGDRLFTVGVAGKMLALDKRDGTVLWGRELWGEAIGGRPQESGYSSSPLAYEGTVIVPVGGETAGLVAFDQDDGAVVWRSPGSKNSYSSPSILEIAGRPQLVVFMAEELIGLDPGTGRLLWRYPHANQWGHNINMPVVADDVVFLSSPQAGARALRLAPDGDSFAVEELWSSRRVQLYHVASVQDGEWVYGSTGVTSPAFLVAVNVKTGEIAWRERGFAKANCIAADGRLVILDEEGLLYLATASPEALVVQARTRILERVAWTVPTVVGTRLYARDNRRVVALELGRPEPLALPNQVR